MTDRVGDEPPNQADLQLVMSGLKEAFP
jgi:hypothetical protein